MQLKKEDYNKKYNKNRLNLSTRRLPSSKVATSHWKQNWAKEAKIWQKKAKAYNSKGTVDCCRES